jgi:hypothetical protein
MELDTQAEHRVFRLRRLIPRTSLNGSGLRRRPVRVSTFLATTGVLLATLVVAAPSAQAVDYNGSSPYWAHAQPNLSVRTAPGYSGAIIDHIPYGWHFNILCQRTDGDDIGGSRIWDAVGQIGQDLVPDPFGGTYEWVSDYWVSGTPYAQPAPGIPECLRR